MAAQQVTSLTKSQQITLQAMRLLREADGAVAHTMPDIQKATKTISRHGATTLNVSRALRALTEAGLVEEMSVEGMGGRLTFWKVTGGSK